MKYNNIANILFSVRTTHSTFLASSKFLFITLGVFIFFSLLIGGYPALPVFLLLTILMYIRYVRRTRAYKLIEESSDSFFVSGEYKPCEKMLLTNVIEKSFRTRNIHKWPATILLVFSLLLALLCGIIQNDVATIVGMFIYGIAAMYYLIFLIAIRSKAVLSKRITKKFDPSVYSDINLTIPSIASANLYCGEQALYHSDSGRLVCYKDIERVKLVVKTERNRGNTTTIERLHICPKGERAIVIPYDAFDAIWLTKECIEPHNTNLAKEGF